MVRVVDRGEPIEQAVCQVLTMPDGRTGALHAGLVFPIVDGVIDIAGPNALPAACRPLARGATPTGPTLELVLGETEAVLLLGGSVVGRDEHAAMLRAAGPEVSRSSRPVRGSPRAPTIPPGSSACAVPVTAQTSPGWSQPRPPRRRSGRSRPRRSSRHSPRSCTGCAPSAIASATPPLWTARPSPLGSPSSTTRSSPRPRARRRPPPRRRRRLPNRCRRPCRCHAP